MFLELVRNPSYWLTTILLSTAIIGKDLYLCSLERNFNYKPYHVLQEVIRTFFVFPFKKLFNVCAYMNVN